MTSFKNLTKKIHTELVNSITLFTTMYPTTPQFNSVFKKDMFIHNNKAAFQHVMHYLLTILDPIEFQTRVPSWPPYNTETETSFRNQVVEYLNDINRLYPGFNLPKITSSHLIAPGGFKFIKYMLQLTNIVMYIHCERDPELNKEVISQPTSDKHKLEMSLELLKMGTQQVNAETCSIKTKFEDELINIQLKFKKYYEAMSNLDSEISHAEESIAALSKESKINFDVSEQMERIKLKLEALQTFRDQFMRCKELHDQLESKAISLKLNKGDSSETLDLNKAINDILKFLRQNWISFANNNVEALKNNLQFYSKMNKRYESLSMQMEQVQEHIEELSVINKSVVGLIQQYAGKGKLSDLYPSFQVS